MRRAGALALTMLWLLTGCGGRGAAATPTPAPEDDARPVETARVYPCTIPEAAIDQSLTIDGEPSIRVEAQSQGYWRNEFAQEVTLLVYLGEETEPIQTLTETTALWPEGFKLLCADVDFDGDLDLYFTYSQGVHNTFYTFYLWDSGEGRFLSDPYSLGDLSNVKFSAEGRFAVASRKTEVSEEITYYRYKEGVLSMTRQLSYDLSKDPKVMRVTEVTAGEEWEPLRIVTPEDFTDEDWETFLAWMDLNYYGEG